MPGFYRRFSFSLNYLKSSRFSGRPNRICSPLLTTIQGRPTRLFSLIASNSGLVSRYARNCFNGSIPEEISRVTKLMPASERASFTGGHPGQCELENKTIFFMKKTSFIDRINKSCTTIYGFYHKEVRNTMKSNRLSNANLADRKYSLASCTELKKKFVQVEYGVFLQYSIY